MAETPGLEVGERYGIGGISRNTSRYLLIEAKETSFEGADGTMLVFERLSVGPQYGERARNIVVRRSGASHAGTRVAYVDEVKDMGAGKSKFHIGIFVPSPIEEGPDIGTSVENVVTSLGQIF